MGSKQNFSNFRDSILLSLRDRNAKECYPFKDLILTQNHAVEANAALRQRASGLSRENEKLKEENSELLIKAESSGGTKGEKTAALEQKLFKLQEEMMEMHRQKGANSQKVIDLNAALQEKDKELQAQIARFQSKESDLLTLNKERKSLEASLSELQAANELLRDEGQALQMAYASLEKRERLTKQENETLVSRLLEQQQHTADKLNDMLEKDQQKRQETLKKQLEDAATEVVDVKEQHMFAPPPLCFSIPSRAVQKFDAHDSEVHAVCWSREGHLLASGSADRRIKLWRYSDYKCEHMNTLSGSNQGVLTIDFDPEDTMLLGGSSDFACRVWSLQTFRMVHTLTGHAGKVQAARFLGDANRIVSGSQDRTLKLWDLRSRACIKTLFAGSSCHDLVTSEALPTNVISGHFDRRIRFWDCRTDSSANEILLQDKVTSLDLSPDRNYLLSCSKDDTLKIIDLRQNQVTATFSTDGFRIASDTSRASFSPDGQYVVAGSSDGSLYVWSVHKKAVEKVLRGEHSHGVIAVAWHPRGHNLLSAERQKRCVLWSNM